MARDSRPRPARGDRTRAVHGSEHEKPGPMSTPIVHSSTFSFASLEAMNAEQDRGADGAYYHRVGHPTLRACERRLAAIESAEDALLFSSGVAALACMFMAQLSAGDHALTLHQSYGGTHDLFRWGAERFGWKVDFLDAREPQTWEKAFRRETRLLHVESPTNPVLCVVDIAHAAELAHAHGARLTVDNTFASPVGQRPLAMGADLVMYSATKSIGGHGDLLAGAVTGSTAAIQPVWKARKVFGPVPDPALAWQIERSLKTLPLRVAAENANALELARRLAEHPAVVNVHYPGLASHRDHAIAARQMTLGFGPVVAFEVAGAAAAESVINAFQLIRQAPSLGGVESLASLPAFTSHIQLGPEGRAKAGIAEGLIRVSVGIEDVEDLWSDLDQALVRAAAVKV
ncbi:MAG: aminotransferase class I/II-fold pyridoxal phosphate-dependent enzyme [Candidatus Eisenbacteria bacterium]|uniref:Aminotransferase class I/II-fold pyridoxal phosphate-dependent enzyme n=1 Tax=Eiseniibacteriota bacterium TaxID=2212470 RepID=A0A9D6L7W1_UNCEI|nr:aminotransferase class I/II-fold pyridoxal phosphate-dependent enzyme [Candidatus Eisenbacteria bacterium]